MTWMEPEQVGILRKEHEALEMAGEQAEADALMAEACLDDEIGLWVLLRYGCGRADAHNQWVFDRCCEVQASPNGHLDLWAASITNRRSSPSP
jgi:hypothetical protein